MRSPRVHTEQPLASGATITLEPEPSRHLLGALRLRPGAALTVFNGDGGEFAATLVDGGGGGAHIQLGDYGAVDRESPLAIHLGMGIARGERMDWVVQKAVELGVTSIAPLFSERSEVRLNAERAGKKHRHWRQIAISACEQCGRNRVPAIGEPLELSAWLASAPLPGLVLDPKAEPGLRQLERPPRAQVSLLIGPEGGLTASEIAAASTAGFVPVRLGPRILRTETAPLAAISAIQLLWGDLC